MPFQKGQSGNPTGRRKKKIAEPIELDINNKLEENLAVLLRKAEKKEHTQQELYFMLKTLDLVLQCKKARLEEANINVGNAIPRVAVLTYDNGRSKYSFEDDPRMLIKAEDVNAYLEAKANGDLALLKKAGR